MRIDFSSFAGHSSHKEQKRGQVLPDFSLHYRQSNRYVTRTSTAVSRAKNTPFLPSLPMQLLTLHTPEVFFNFIERDKDTRVRRYTFTEFGHH